MWNHRLAIKLEAVRKHYSVRRSCLQGLVLWHGRSRKTLTQRKFPHYSVDIWALMSLSLSFKNKVWVGLRGQWILWFAEFAKQLIRRPHRMCCGKERLKSFRVKMGVTKCRMTILFSKSLSAPRVLCLKSPRRENVTMLQFFLPETWGGQTLVIGNCRWKDKKKG